MSLPDQERTILITNYQEKSRAAIENVNFLLDNQKLFLAINQIYYGIYYMLSALALKQHFETTKHQQLIGWFNKTFIKTEILDRKYGKWVLEAYENRMKGDYNVLAEFTEEKVKEAFAKMQEIIAAIEPLLDKQPEEQQEEEQ